MVRDTEDRSGHFLHRKERLTQWYPLAMIAYGIGVLHIIREILDAHLRVTHIWYAYDAGLGRGIWSYPRTLTGPAGEAATEGIINGTDQ